MPDERQAASASDSTVTIDLSLALRKIASVIRQGARTHRPDEFRTHDAAFHVGRAAAHCDRWESGDDTEDHLGNAAVRLLFENFHRSRGIES
jgi:hypothetical protein